MIHQLGLPASEDHHVRRAGQETDANSASDVLSELLETVRRLEKQVGAVLEQGSIRESLGKHAIYPYYKLLQANGISRDVGDALREKGELRPFYAIETGNSVLYIDEGQWKRFVASRKDAPPPSKTRLSRSMKQRRKAA